MGKRFEKFLVSATIVMAFCLSLHELILAFSAPRPGGFVCASLVWLLLAAMHLPEAAAAYEDRLFRRLVMVPLILSVSFSLAGIVVAMLSSQALLAFFALCLLWLCALVDNKFLRAGFGYDTVGSGYLSREVWLNPPVDVIPEGALILTDGRMARRAKNSVGHSELVVKDPNGKLHVASSYIETGVVIHTLRSFIAVERRNKENYIVLVPREPLTLGQSAELFRQAHAVLTANKTWRDSENDRRTRIFSRLPLPRKWRALLLKYCMSNGYDPLGKYWGGSRRDRFTCMAHNLHLLRSVGMPVGEYGTGAFGLFGEFNPLLPIRLMRDTAYRVLTKADKKVFDASRPTVSSCGCG